MPNGNDMENAGVSRVDVDESSMLHDASQAASAKVTSEGIKRSKDKRGKFKDKGDKGSEGKAKSSADKADAAEDAGPKGLKPGDGAKNGEASPVDSAKGGVKAVKNAGGAAGTAVKGGMLVKMLNFMQMALAMGANAATTALAGPLAFLSAIGQFFSGVASTVAGGVSAVAGFFGGAISAVAGFFGIGTTAAAVTVVTSSLVAAFSAVGIVASVILGTMNVAQRDGALPDCSVAVAKAMEGAEIDADAQLLNNAKSIYSVLHTYGLSDEQIAGVLGNFSTESGIDPTSIEGIYGEHYNINGSKHQEAIADLDAYVRGPLSAGYAGFGGSGGPVKNPGGYTAGDGKMYPGIGMGQYTGGGAKTFLDAAEAVGSQWYTIDFQLAYTLAKGAPASGPGFWEKYKQQSGDAAAMARYFSQYWEGNTSNGQEQRQSSATSWMEQLGSWSADSTYANNVISMAGRLGATATDNNVAKKKSSCVKTVNADNSSIATAAVSYAYETQDEGRGNNGTAPYR